MGGVGVVGRPALLTSALLPADPDDLIRLRALIQACPPTAGEVLPVPLTAARRWLTGDTPAGVSDTLINPADDAGPGNGNGWRPALVFAGDDSRVALRPGDLEPNAVLVVPAGYGGWRDGTWDPAATEPVPDVATSAARLAGQAILRLSPELLTAAAVPRPDPQEPLTQAETRRAVRSWLTTAQPATTDPDVPKVIEMLLGAGDKLRPVVIDLSPTEQRYVLHGPRPRAGADSEPATSAFLGQVISLPHHLHTAKEWADRLGQACGLPDPTRKDLVLAAFLHDLGKADPRCQYMLAAGVPGVGALLAKSRLAASDYRGRRRAALASGYPPGTRHELTSVALVQHETWLHEQAHDLDLVLHLVASHHGYARPFLPVPAAAAPIEVTVTHDGHVLSTCSDHGLISPAGGVPDRFWRCVRRYGWHGLAWLEALLRLADHRASEENETPQ